MNNTYQDHFISETTNDSSKSNTKNSIDSNTESEQSILNEMGYNKEMIENVYTYLKPNTITEAIELMRQIDGIYQHDFFENNDKDDTLNKGKCLICGSIRKFHIDYDSEDDEEINDNNNTKVIKKKYCEMCSDKCLTENEINENKLKCGHLGCNSCLYKYIKGKIKYDMLSKITCFGDGCNQIISDDFINKKMQGKKRLLKKYEEAKYKAEIRGDPHKKFCPYPDCSGYLLKNDNDDKYVFCNINKNHKYCFICLKAWHGKINCDQEIDKDLKTWTNGKIIKNCPNCKFYTEKNGGCNHLTCPECKFQWCWLCEGKYELDHYSRGLCTGKQFKKENFIQKIKILPKYKLPENKDLNVCLESEFQFIKEGKWMGNKGWYRFFQLLFITFTCFVYYQIIIYENFTETCRQRYGRGVQNVIALLTFICLTIYFQIHFIIFTLLTSILTIFCTKYNLLYNIYLTSFEGLIKI